MSSVFDRRLRRDEASVGSDPECEKPSCEGCGRSLEGDELFARYRVCSQCGRHHSLSARERIALLADPGTF